MKNHYRLIYTSFAFPDLDLDGIHKIVTRAIEKNRRLDVTGLLIFDGLRLCQYLEGPGPALRDLLLTIRADPRHLQFSLKEEKRLEGSRLFAASPLRLATTRAPDDLDRLQRFDSNNDSSTDSSAIALLESLLPSLILVP